MGRYRIQQYTNKTTASSYKKNRHTNFFGCKLVKKTPNYHQQNRIAQ